MAQWSENAKKVLSERYLIKDKTGNLVETPDKMLERVARYISSAEPDYLKEEYYNKFLGIMDSLEFLPNSPTLINAGRKNPQLSACFVLPIYDSLDSIFEMVKQSALIHKSGGGTGFSFSSLRPAGAVVASTHGVASGPISFMSVFNAVTEVVKQGGVRRGANMGILNYSHPDIMEFIDCKQDKKSFSNFNISVGTNGGFFDKVLNDELIQLRFRGFPYKGQIKARDIFNKLCHNAWETGEPGILFFDTINKFNPTPWLGNIWASNPCLVGDTKMLTSQGLKKIKDITVAKFLTPNGWSSGKVWKTGRKQVLKLTLSNGQSIVVTPDHKFSLPDGSKKEARFLLGVRVEPFLGNGEWVGEDFDITSLIQLGFIQGDAGFKKETKGFYVYLGNNDKEVSDTLFKDLEFERGNRKAKYVKVSHYLNKLVDQFSMERVALPYRNLPSMVWKFSPKSISAFLRGLYSANGSVILSAKRITLKTTNLQLASDVQQLLIALGFRPYITTNRSKLIKWSNGNYTSRESYDVNIVCSEAQKFQNNIGFVQTYKQNKLAKILTSITNHRLLPIVTKVESGGEVDVYDFNVEDSSHLGWANGFLVSNCSEAPLLPFESCNLGSINLHKLVEGGKFDFERLISLVKLATRFLDDTIDVNNFPRIQIARATKLTRKVGLGVMGWADVLGALKIAYDSETAFKLAEKIMANIKKTAYQTSGELAQEKGTPQKRLKRRNTCLMAIAPTGTLSLLANCLGGETAIDTLEGKIPVKELVGKEPFLYSYNTTKREVVIQRARAIWSRGRQETYRITFDTGDILETTQDHRIMLLNSSYKNVSQLQVGDRVKAFYKWADKNKHFMIRASDTVARKQSWLCFELFNNQHIAQGKLGRYPWLIHHKDGNSFNDSPENLVKMTNREHALLHKPFLATLSSEVRKKISITQKKKFEDVAYKLQIAAATKKGMWSEEGRKNLLGGIEKRRSYKGNLNPAYKKEIDVWVVTNEKKHFCLCGCGKFVSIKRRHHYSGIPQYIRGHKKTTIKNHMVIKIEKMGVQEVYDIDMGEGHPNFSANGVFVHNCSSGIEPHFARAYTKNVINGVTLNLGTEYEVKTAMEISPENHVRTLASFQKYTDQGVSKTINLPQEAIVEDVKKVMILAHKLGAKGLTVYRQGSRDEAPLQELSECSDEKCLV